jgi:hypothetical protein
VHTGASRLRLASFLTGFLPALHSFLNSVLWICDSGGRRKSSQCSTVLSALSLSDSLTDSSYCPYCAAMLESLACCLFCLFTRSAAISCCFSASSSAHYCSVSAFFSASDFLAIVLSVAAFMLVTDPAAWMTQAHHSKYIGHEMGRMKQRRRTGKERYPRWATSFSTVAIAALLIGVF